MPASTSPPAFPAATRGPPTPAGSSGRGGGAGFGGRRRRSGGGIVELMDEEHLDEASVFAGDFAAGLGFDGVADMVEEGAGDVDAAGFAGGLDAGGGVDG